MMSIIIIIIKGMEMPKNCAECFFHKVFPATGVGINQLYCALCGINIVKLSDAQPDCPLVPVPPHGRLIDADALVEILLKVIDINASIEQRNEATEQERRCLWWFEQQIGIAPTIIPAEEGE